MRIQVKIMKPSKLLSVLLSVTLALFFFSAAIAVPILCRPFYYWQARSLKLAEQTGWDENIIHEAYNEVMDYLVRDAPFGTGALKWSESGKSHFADCKRLFRLDFVLLAVSVALLAVLILLQLTKRISFHNFMNRSPAFWSAAALSLLFALCALWALLDFNGLFTAFHTVFFPGKTNWIFDYRTDEIILILPEAFWAHTGALVLGICIGGSVLTATVSEIVRKAAVKGKAS